MWKLQSLFCPYKDDGKNNRNNNTSNSKNNNKRHKYDPRWRVGTSNEEAEWRSMQYDRVCRRMPQVLLKFDIHSRKARRHFLDDPDALKEWDGYENYVRNAFAHNLDHTLSTPAFPPDSVLYKHLMKRKARARTFVGMLSGGLDKIKQAKMDKRVGALVAILAAGLGTAGTAWKEQQKRVT